MSELNKSSRFLFCDTNAFKFLKKQANFEKFIKKLEKFDNPITAEFSSSLQESKLVTEPFFCIEYFGIPQKQINQSIAKQLLNDISLKQKLKEFIGSTYKRFCQN